MIVVRDYRETDAEPVVRLIAGTFTEFNLADLAPDEKALFRGPFQYARSQKSIHRESIAQVIRVTMEFVAEEGGEIVGVLRGRRERLQGPFVGGHHHRQGIGRRLSEQSPEFLEELLGYLACPVDGSALTAILSRLRKGICQRLEPLAKAQRVLCQHRLHLNQGLVSNVDISHVVGETSQLE